jgi:diaminopropionate ammonia-lyase
MIWLRTSSRVPSRFFAIDELADVRRFYEAAAMTPLQRLPALAARLGIGDLLIKDETARFGLPAFKTLGVRYAVARLLAERRHRVSDLACATAGNHGFAVARVAREHGLLAHVYVPFGTSPDRIAALRSEDAHVAVTSVGYDDTVRLMAEEAASRRATIVSDTAWEGYEEIPRWIMAGYTRLMDEAATQWVDPPDIVIVQAGVGSLAGAVAAWLEATLGPEAPPLVVVEPDGSACVHDSLRAGHPVRLTTCAPTSMTGLRCGEMSSIAWAPISANTAAAITVSDVECAAAMQALAAATNGDPVIHAGPSGAAGIAALTSLQHGSASRDARKHLRLSGRTRAMAIVTEHSF